MVNRLQKSPVEVQNLYHETFSGHLERGEIVELNSEEKYDCTGNFITPVLVYKPESAKTKLRICWNLSLKNKYGKSINNAVLPGMNLIRNLLSHIMSIRKHKYLVMSDVQKAFLRIKYLNNYTKYFKLLYARNLDVEPKLYKIVSVLFGFTSSPFILNRTLRYHIEKVMVEEPTLTEFCINLHKSFYLDDLGASFRSIEEAKIFIHKANHILKMENFKLTQWVASEPTILVGLDKDLIKPLAKNEIISMRTGTSLEEAPQILGSANKLIEFGGEFNATENNTVGGLKCLGVSYSPVSGKFFFEKEKLEKISKLPVGSKRELLSTLPKIFDPAQILSPLILKGMQLFSTCCSKIPKIGWDEPLEDPLKSEVKNWQSGITVCSKIQIGRWIPFPKNRKKCYILTAGDGAKCALSARAFIFIEKSDLPKGAPFGNVYIDHKLVKRPNTRDNLFASFYVLSKTKIVNKNTKHWSTQKSELKGALLAAELTDYLSKLYEIDQNNCVCLLDSQSALYWIQTAPENLSVFHANVVTKIVKLNFKFRYINTSMNFADMLTTSFSTDNWITPYSEKEYTNFFNFWLGPEKFDKNIFNSYPELPSNMLSNDEYFSGIKKNAKVLLNINKSAKINTNLLGIQATLSGNGSFAERGSAISCTLLPRFFSIHKMCGVASLIFRFCGKISSKAPVMNGELNKLLKLSDHSQGNSLSSNKNELNFVLDVII